MQAKPRHCPSALTLPMPADYQLPVSRTETRWAGRVAVALRYDDKSRAAGRARVAYRETVIADLKAAGAHGKTRWLEEVKSAEVPRARKFLDAAEFTLKRMSDGAFNDGAGAVTTAFGAWSLDRQKVIAGYELAQTGSAASAAEGQQRTADLLIPHEKWEMVARIELYRKLDELGAPHGRERVEHADALYQRLEELRSGKCAIVEERARRVPTREGFPHAKRSSLAENPAVLTLTRIRGLIQEVLVAPRPEGAAPDAAAASPSRAGAQVDRYVLLSEPPPPGTDQREHDIWWVKNQGALLAFFVGKTDVERLIEVLRSEDVDPTHLARAAALLRSTGRRSEDFNVHWTSLKSVVRHANQVAQKLHTNLTRSGQAVPGEQAPAFARAALGAHFQRQSESFGELRYRNGVAADLYRRVAQLASGRKPIPQVELAKAVEEALAARVPGSQNQEEAVRLYPLPVDRDSKSSAASRAKAAEHEAQAGAEPVRVDAPSAADVSLTSPLASPERESTQESEKEPGKARSPRTTVVSRAPKGVSELLKQVGSWLDTADLTREPDKRAELIEKARSGLRSTRDQLEQAALRVTSRTPDKVPYWVTGGRAAIEKSEARLTAISAAH